MSLIAESNSTQRNWNLYKDVDADIDLLLTDALQNAPSKQNLPFYIAHLCSDRDLIEKIHANTMGYYDASNIIRPNDQVLAHRLIAFEAYEEPNKYYENMDVEQYNTLVRRDQLMAVGIASGYVNLVAHQHGLKTGYCACHNDTAIRDLLEADGEIITMIGVGHPDTSKDKNDSMYGDYKYKSRPKKKIEVLIK